MENRLILRVKCQELIIPFVKSNVSFQLAHELDRDIDNFVAVQELPYVRLAVLGRFVNIKRNGQADGAVGTFVGERYFEVTE